MSTSSFNSFPADKKDFLAIIYLQNQDLSGKSPEEIALLYDDAYTKIDAKLSELRKARKDKKHEQESRSMF